MTLTESNQNGKVVGMSLAQQTEQRLIAAGFTSQSPELVRIRDHNRQAMEEGWLRVELRRGQFAQTRRVRLRDLEDAPSGGG